MNAPEPVIIAALGPTNTGKTHRAVQRMLDYPTGMIGLPLRLLAREVYDRITQELGEAQVALITGEEKRIPKNPRYFVCTVEAMPVERGVDFLAVDEIQLAGHAERGHVFTERLLHARGRRETWFMGASTMEPLVRQLVPGARVQRFPRLSRLSAAGSYSIGSLPPRSAVVAFSATRLYALAERLRARRGGAAVVLGSLSPRARNAQVAMYQAGEVDYLVATDAIGMGLNLDVDRIAFAERRKFDGRETRALDLAELSQIAGRAGRYQTDGAFGTLAPEPALPPDIERRIERHRLPQQHTLIWRNHELAFDSILDLIASLKRRPESGPLRALAYADDFQALTTLAKLPEISDRASSQETVRLLWDVCQIPDYRQLLLDRHEKLLGEIFIELCDRSRISDHYLQARVARLDRIDGDIETLMQRIAFVRTWTYVANHDTWLAHALEWQERTRAIEDKLSDALHQALVARFIDPGRSGQHQRMPSQRSARSDHPFSALERLRAQLVGAAEPEPGAPAPHQTSFAHALAEAPHQAFSVSDNGRISFRQVEVARFGRGRVLIEPEVHLASLELAPGALGQVRRRMRAFGKDFVSHTLADLAEEPAEASPAVRGLLYQLRQSLGTLECQSVQALLGTLSDQDQRLLSSLGITVGKRAVFAPRLLDPASLRQRRVLVRSYYGKRATLSSGSPSLAQATSGGVDATCYLSQGFLVLESYAIRADILETLLERSAPASRGRLSARAIERTCRVDPTDAERIARALTRGTPGHPRPKRRRRRSRPRAPKHQHPRLGGAPRREGE